MSGIFGIFNRNGKLTDKKVINTMLDAMSYWEPDDTGTWVNDSIALGHTMLWNTPESKYEHLPLEKDAYILTMDARIDNREELVTQLELPNRPLEEIGDSEFILAAYIKWGEACPKHLLGDFAFAIWDKEKQQLFCARDHVGIKPLYYHLSDNLFVFSNDIKSILTHVDVSPIYNDNAVALYLTTNDIVHKEWTFYESIVKLPAATSMTVSCTEVQREQYWKTDNIHRIHYDSDKEYAQHLYILIEKAIRVRLRSVFPVAAHLSGGLDSSSIAVIAARILRKSKRKLFTFSWIHKPSDADNEKDFEWAHCKQIAESEEILHNHVCLEENDYVEYLKYHDVTYGDTMQLWSEIAVRKEADNKGVRTLLSGWGGDELISYNGRAYFRELASEKSPMQAIQKMCKKYRNSLKRLSRMIKMSFKTFILPKLPYYLSYRLQGYFFLKKELPFYVNDTFRDKIHFRDIPIEHFKLQPTKAELFSYGHIQRRIESWNVAGMDAGIEYAYPLLDKNIVEFALGIPSEMFSKNGKQRYIYKLAMEGVLPGAIQWGDFKEEINGGKQIHVDVSRAVMVWKETIKHNRNSYIDIDKLILTIECSQDETCYKNDKRMKIGNIKFLDYIQGILFYSIFR